MNRKLLLKSDRYWGKISPMIKSHIRLFAAMSAAAALACAAPAATVAHIAVPPPEYADGESSSMATVPARGPSERTVEVKLSFSASPTNNAEFALADSRLPEADATVLTAGWDLGEWVVAGPRPGQRLAVAAGPSTAGSRMLIMGMRLDGRGNVARVWFEGQAGGGAPVAIGFGPGAQDTILSWLADSGGAWDSLLATSRGHGDASQVSASLGLAADSSVIIVR
jgi:hypothetical protein